MATEDTVTMDRFLRSEGTDAATAKTISDVVSEAWRAHFGADAYVPFSVRYSIAHEVQRRLANQPNGDHP